MKRISLFFSAILLATFFAANVADAAGVLPFKRMMYVSNKNGELGSTAGIDAMLNEMANMNVDAIMAGLGSEYFEAVRDPNGVYPVTGEIKKTVSPRASWNMLEYLIQQAHAKNIQVHVWIVVNTQADKRAEDKLFGTQYRVLTRNTTATPSTYTKHAERNDIGFTVLANYEVSLLTFIAQHYATLDGIHIEEPLYPYDESYAQPIIDRYITKYGVDPRTVVEDATVRNRIDGIMAEYMNSFFTQLRASINANKANPNLLLSATAGVAYTATTGFNPKYMATNNLLDWYAAQIYKPNFNTFTSITDSFSALITEIPNVPTAGMEYCISGVCTYTNPEFINEIKVICQHGGDAEGAYWYPARNLIVGGVTIAQGLHDNPPFMLCSSSSVAMPTFSPPGGNYATTRSVTISSTTAGSTIYYTIDGSTPTTSSLVYSTPISVSSTTTLKAIAVKTGLADSSVAIALYTIGVPPPLCKPEIGNWDYSYYSATIRARQNKPELTWDVIIKRYALANIRPGVTTVYYDSVDPQSDFKMTDLNYVKSRFDMATADKNKAWQYGTFLLSEEVLSPSLRAEWTWMDANLNTWTIDGEMTLAGVNVKALKPWYIATYGAWGAADQAWWDGVKAANKYNDPKVHAWSDYYSHSLYKAWDLHMQSLGKKSAIMGPAGVGTTDIIGYFNKNYGAAATTYILQNYDAFIQYHYVNKMGCATWDCTDNSAKTVRDLRNAGYAGKLIWLLTAEWNDGKGIVWNQAVAQDEFNKVVPYVDVILARGYYNCSKVPSCIAGGGCPRGCGNPPDPDCPAGPPVLPGCTTPTVVQYYPPYIINFWNAYSGTCPTCGNGIIDTGEVCDISGNVGCSAPTPTCQAGCASCAGAPPPPPVCGNGVVDSGETCDVLGDVGCSAPTPNCQAGCASCEAVPPPPPPLCGTADGICPAGCSNPPDLDCALSTIPPPPATCAEGDRCQPGCTPPDPDCPPVCANVPGSAGLVPCGRYINDPATLWNECDPCNLCRLLLMIQLIMEFLIKISAAVALISIIYAGLVYMFAIGNLERIRKAKLMMKYSLMGVAVVFMAWVFADGVLASLGYINPLGGNWYTICSI